MRNSTPVAELCPLNRSFTRWYEADYHRVVGLLFVLTGCRSAAEELTQEAFLEAFRRWDTVSGYDNPGAWVRHVAVNRARSWGRRTGAEVRAYERYTRRDRAVPSELPPSADDFWTQVRGLPDRQAAVVALYYFDDLPVEEIATLLDVHTGTVKTQLHRARATLASQLASDGGDEIPLRAA